MGSSAAGNSVMTSQPLSVTTTSSSLRAADTEGAVVAGAVAHVRLDDVEERLVAGADQPVGEVVRVRAAALTGHRVHGLNVVGPHRIEHVVDAGDDVRLAHTGFQLLVDH